MPRFTDDGRLRKSKRPAGCHTGHGGAAARPASTLPASHVCADLPRLDAPSAGTRLSARVGPSPAPWATDFPGPPPSVHPHRDSKAGGPGPHALPWLVTTVRGQTEDSGQAVCAASFLGRPPESPGQVRGRGPRYSACRTAGKGVSGGQPSGSARPCPGLRTECVLSRAPWGGGRPEPTRPSLLVRWYFRWRLLCSCFSVCLTSQESCLSVRLSVRRPGSPLWRVCTKRLLQGGAGDTPSPLLDSGPRRGEGGRLTLLSSYAANSRVQTHHL